MVLTLRDGMLALGMLVIDQATKYGARAWQPNNDLFTLTYNTGAGFGILQGNNLLLLVISLTVLAFVAREISVTQGKERIAYLALGSGIVGNSIDRVCFGAVTDFISVGTFPVFNVADSLITVSIAYLVAVGVSSSFTSWNYKRKTRK